jgi:putative transposase
MARQKRKPKPLATIWEVSDDLWTIIEPILNTLDPPRSTPGRGRIDQRAALDGVIYQMRSGCQWNSLPEKFGDDSSVHRTFQRWISKGVLEAIWAKLVVNCQELGGVHWDWQSADGAMGKARFGGILSAPTPQIVGRMAASGV